MRGHVSHCPLSLRLSPFLTISVTPRAQENGGEGLKFQQDRQADAEKLCAALKDKIAAIKETKDAQKARDALLKKQMKQRATKQKPEDPDATPLLPAWVPDLHRTHWWLGPHVTLVLTSPGPM